MRLLLLGAFAYPHHQGSQVYFQEQAIALRDAGIDVTLMTYASGLAGPESARALDGFDHTRSAAWSAPASIRSGPGWGKPLADLALAMTLRDAVASRGSDDAYDAILTHNAEAALIALGSLRKPRPPIVYCAHTLLGNELSSYLKRPKPFRFSDYREPEERRRPWRFGPRHGLDAIGRRIDRQIARRVEGWIALTHESERVMRHFSNAPGAIIPPCVPDPEADPGRLDPSAVARRHGLEPGEFFLYSGNLDAYQELGILEAAASQLGDGPDPAPRIVLASHDPACLDRRPRAGAAAGALTPVQVGSGAEMQALLASARASLVMRRMLGGFPIKLANSLAVGTPVVAFREREWGLTDGLDSLICASERPATSLARAIRRLSAEPELARRLAVGARRLYQRRHRPEDAARATLDLIQQVRAACLSRRAV